jgi:disulfide oxidoreductase YuzD
MISVLRIQESHVERNSELVPVWWWFISGRVCHLSHISKLPELTEKQKMKQQSLFASFNSKYHKEVKFVEFGSSWADQKHISYENNMIEEEFLQSQSSLDLINVRNNYQRNYIAFELERSLLNEKKKIKLWEEVKNEKNIFNRSLIELQILQKELIRAKDVYFTDYARSSRKIIEKQRGVLIRYIEYLNFKEKEISLVHENSRNLFAEYFSMYFWLCDNPVSIQYLSTTYSLKSFLQKHDRQRRHCIKQLYNQVMLKTRIHSSLLIAKKCFTVEEHAETYSRLRFYLKVPTFPLKLYYIDVNKEAELMFLLG